METFKSVVATTLITLAFVAVFLVLADVAVGKVARAECLKWQDYETKYQGFELSAEGEHYCQELGISIK